MSEVTSKLGTNYDKRSRAVSLKMAMQFRETTSNAGENDRHDKITLSLKAKTVEEMKSWVTQIGCVR